MLATLWAVPALAGPATPTQRFDLLRAQDLRVAAVSYRLSIANRGLCQSGLAPQAGLILHGIEQYGPGDRAGAARIYGLGREVGIMAVVADSPAARAGLMAQDQLIAVNGVPLRGASGPGNGVQTRALVEQAQQILAGEMAKGEVRLAVAGPRGERVVRLRADWGCPANVELVPSGEINAWADGARVMLTDAILAQCASDDDLALVIAHELAHNFLHHRARLALAGLPDSRLLPVSAAGSARIRETEEAADRLAVQIAGTAGYDLGGAAAFLDALLDANGLSRGAAATHPEPVRRLTLLRAAIAAFTVPRD